MFIEERQNKILEIISKEKSVTVNKLKKILNVSGATIRSDLNELSKKGLINRTHGGATAVQETESGLVVENNLKAKLSRNYKFKAEIADKAVQYIKNDSCIVLDASSTAFELAKRIKETNLKLMILTSSLNVVVLFKDSYNITVILIGGVYSNEYNATIGDLGSDIMKRINIDIAFVSGHAISIEKGLTEFNPFEVRLKEAIVKHSMQVIALFDYTKLDLVSTTSFAEVSEIDILITNVNDVEEELLKKFKKNNFKVE